MNDEPRQRWNASPTAEATAGWAVRRELVHWQKGDRERVKAFFARQPNPAVQQWLWSRGLAYGVAYPDETEGTHFAEALLDLLCWQRQEQKPAVALRWLRDWERGVAEVEQVGR